MLGQSPIPDLQEQSSPSREIITERYRSQHLCSHNRAQTGQLLVLHQRWLSAELNTFQTRFQLVLQFWFLTGRERLLVSTHVVQHPVVDGDRWGDRFGDVDADTADGERRDGRDRRLELSVAVDGRQHCRVHHVRTG